MKNIRILMFASVAVLAFANSCKKDDTPDTSKYTIYTTGQYRGVDGYVSCYWKNSERVDVPDLAPNYFDRREIFVSNGVVYLAGARSSGGGLAPSYWKNGVRTDLDMGVYTSGSTEYIKVANGKVYTAGNVGSRCCYWINNERTDITDLPDGASSTYVTGLFVVGNDVYLCGHYEKSRVIQACFWKNGVRTDMPETPSWSSSIFVDNGKVYVAGRHDPTGSPDDYIDGYWVDGQMVKMITGGFVMLKKKWIEN